MTIETRLVRPPESSARVNQRPVTLRPTQQSKLWDELVRASPAGLKYHEWEWLDLQEQVLGGKIDRLLVHVGDQPVGIFPVPRKRPGSRKRLPVPFPFLGPLVPAHLVQETFEVFRRYQMVSGPVVSRVDLGPRISEGLRGPLAMAGCRTWEETTVVVDLSHGSKEALHEGFSSMRRRAIRRATRDGASVRAAEPGELTRLLPKLLDEAYAANGTHNPYPSHLGRLVEEWAGGRDDIAVFTGLVDDEPAGVRVVLGDGRTALDWVGATERRFRGVDVTALLLERCLEWSIDRGCEQIDLCGSVNEGVLRYKLSFGGSERAYLTAESSPMPSAFIGAARSLRGRTAR